MKICLSILLLVTALGAVRADTPATPPPPPVGIIILKAVAGYPAADAWFTSIQWVDNSGGYVIDKTGAKLPFVNDAIGRVIYFDRNYYEEVNHNPYWLDWRAGLQSRELLLPPVPSGVLEQGDAKRLADEQASLQDAINLYSNGADLVQPLIDTLKDEQSKLASGLVFQNGAWVAEKDAGAAPSAVPVVGESEDTVTFTTKDGKRFEKAKVTTTATGLSVLTPDGGASVSFDRLPDDLSPFPQAVQTKVAEWRSQQVQVQAAEVASAQASTGWLAWLSSTWQYVANAFESLFTSSKSGSGSH